MIRYDNSIFSPDTYHSAILAALRQRAANQDTRYLNMLATMNGMARPVPNLQAGIVQRLPDVPFGYNNPHNGPPTESLLPPPLYQPPESPTESRHSAPDTVVGAGAGGGTSVTNGDPASGLGGGADAGGLTGNGLSTAGDQGATVADLSPSTPTSNETPATLSPDETQAENAPATQVATPTQPGFPGWDQVGNPAPNSNFNQNAPPAPPANPLNEPDESVAPTEMASPTPTAPALTVDMNGNPVSPGLPSVNDPTGFAVSMAGVPSSGLLHSVNNSDMTNPDQAAISVGLPNSVAVAVNQANKGDSLDAMDVAPTTTVTVAPPDVPSDMAVSTPAVATPAAPAPAAPSVANALANTGLGLLADVTGAKANAPANALAQEQENSQQAEQATANVAALNSPGLVTANLSSMNDIANALSNPSSFNVDPGFSTGFNVAGPVTGSLYGSGFMGDQGVLAGDLNSATNMNANVAALMDNVNTDFNAPGFEQDAANNPAQDAISAALDSAATNAISNEAASTSPSAAPAGYSPGDMAADTSAGLGFGGFSGLGDVTGGFDAGGFSGVDAGASAAADASGGFSGSDAGAGIGVGADAGVSGDASGSAGVDAGGNSGDGGW